MKITVNIDCTPQEARLFFGLPDVQHLQAAVLAEIEQKMLREMENFSTEKIMANWMTHSPQNMDWFKSMMQQFAAGGADDKKSTP